MTAFAYTSGNTANLVGGGVASMTDIRGPFLDLVTFFNSNVIDASTNLAASVFAPYLTINQGQSAAGSAQILSALHKIFIRGSSVGVLSSGSTISNGAAQCFAFDPADYTLTGRTPKLRMTVYTCTGATAPAVTLTYGLYAIATAAGTTDSMSYTFTTPIVTGSGVSLVTPAGSSMSTSVTSDFTLPAAGTYNVGVQTDAGLASGSMIGVSWLLQVHWI